MTMPRFLFPMVRQTLKDMRESYDLMHDDHVWYVVGYVVVVMFIVIDLILMPLYFLVVVLLYLFKMSHWDPASPFAPKEDHSG